MKPDNVLIGADGRPHVADFGLARLDGSQLFDEKAPTLPPLEPGGVTGPTPLQVALSADGLIVGTPLYMSPEQHLGQPSDGRSDQFSFCVSLFEALYKQLPFEGQSVAAIRYKVVSGKVSLPPETSPVPLSVLKVLLRGMSVAPDNRFPSMYELLIALSKASAEDPALDPSSASPSRRRFVIGMVIFVLLSQGMLWLSRYLGADKLQSSLAMTVMNLWVILGLTAYYRNSLLSNVFHRGAIAVGLTMCGQLLITRVLAMIEQLTFPQVMSFDLLFVAGCTGIIGAMFIPRVWLLTPIALTGSLTAAVFPQFAPTISGILSPMLVSLTLYFYDCAAETQKRQLKAWKLLR